MGFSLFLMFFISFTADSYIRVKSRTYSPTAVFDYKL